MVKKVLTLNDLPTVRQLLENGVLKRPEEVQEDFKPDDKLLDKVSFLWVACSKRFRFTSHEDFHLSQPIFGDGYCSSRGDITVIGIDAIVNAANKSLLGVNHIFLSLSYILVLIMIWL